MGYSISFQVRNPALGKKMVAFLRKHGRSMEHLVGVKDADPSLYGPYWADGKGDKESRDRGGLSYVHRKGHIGFDYGNDREYKYCLLKWMAQKIGVKHKGVHRYLYDGYEWIDIVPEETNSLGMPVEERYETDLWAKMHFKELKYINGKCLHDIVKPEIERLDALWEKR
jgi:hypothetical protein